jgi:hypothetical protein
MVSETGVKRFCWSVTSGVLSVSLRCRLPCRSDGLSVGRLWILIFARQEEAAVAAFASVDRPQERKYGDPP